MRLLRRIARRLLHEFRSIFGARPVAGNALQQLATANGKLTAEQRWVSSVVLANLREKATSLGSRLGASAEGRAWAETRARDVADYVRLGGRLPPR